MLAPIVFILTYVSWIIIIVVVPLALGFVLIGLVVRWHALVVRSLSVLIGLGGLAVALLLIFGVIGAAR